MNWRIKDRDVTGANFSDANSMMGRATDTMNKGFDAAKNSVDSLNTMFDSRLTKIKAIEEQRDLIEQTQVRSEFDRGIEQILAENPNDPLAQEEARNALIRDMRQQGGMYDHQLGQLKESQSIDPENKVKYLKNRRTQLESEANRLNMDPSQQASMIREQLRNEASERFGGDAPQLLHAAGIDVSYGNLGGSDFAATALAGNVNGATGSGTPVTADGTGQPGAVPQTGGTGDVDTLYQQGVERNLANAYYAGNPPSNTPGSTMTSERADNYRLQLHNSKNTDLINLDPTKVTTFADARRETKTLGEKEYNQKGRHLAFGPYQIIMGNVDAGTFERAGIEVGEDAPLTLENQRKLAFALARERIQGGGDTELDKTFVGLASVRKEVLEKLGVPDLKGSTLIEYAKEKYGHDSERENLDSLIAELEDDIIKTEGSPGTLEAVNYMRAAEGQEARNEESKAIAEEMRKNQNSDRFFGDGDLNSPSNVYRNVDAVRMQIQDSRSRLNAIAGFTNYEQVSNDGRNVLEIIGKEDDGNIDWMDGETHPEKVKNVVSMIRGLKSAAAKEELMISDAEAFAILKSKYSSDWFGTDLGKKWKAGGGLDKEESKDLVKELKIGDLAKTRHDLAVLNSAENILKSGAVALENLTIEIQNIELQAGELGYERKLSPEEAKAQLLDNRKYNALVTERKRILGRMKNASSQVFNNPAYGSPKSRLAQGITDATGEGTPEVGKGGEVDSPKDTPTQLIENLVKSNKGLQSLIEGPTEKNKVDNTNAIVRVQGMLKAIKKDTNEGQDLEAYLKGDKLKSLRHLIDSKNPDDLAPDNFYHYLSSAILKDGFVLNSKEHREDLMKQWKEMESQALESKRSGSQFDTGSQFDRWLSKRSSEYRKLNTDESNSIAFSLFAP